MRNLLCALQLVFVTCRAVPARAPWLLQRQKSASTLVPVHSVGTCITPQATNFELLLQVCKSNLAGRKPSLSLSPCNLWCCKKAAVASPVCGVRARPAASTPLEPVRLWVRQVTEKVPEVKFLTNELPFGKCLHICSCTDVSNFLLLQNKLTWFTVRNIYLGQVLMFTPSSVFHRSCDCTDSLVLPFFPNNVMGRYRMKFYFSFLFSSVLKLFMLFLWICTSVVLLKTTDRNHPL